MAWANNPVSGNRLLTRTQDTHDPYAARMAKKYHHTHEVPQPYCSPLNKATASTTMMRSCRSSSQLTVGRCVSSMVAD